MSSVDNSPPPNDGIPYIGSRISLISKKDIRYEGVLYNINTQESTVALQTVRSFGTEGRRQNEREEVPPSDTVYEYVIFRGADIKDLHVCEAPRISLPDDPAIISSRAQQPQSPHLHIATPSTPVSTTYSSPRYGNEMNHLSNTNYSTGSMEASSNISHATSEYKSPRNQAIREQHHHQHHHQQQAAHSHSQRGGSRTIPGMGGHLLRRKERGGHGGASGNVNGNINEEFDIESSLGGFDKEMEFSKLSLEDSKKESSTVAYSKSSFFDTLSCDALDKTDRKQNRSRAAEERKLNTETFGAVSLNDRRFYRGRGGRGKGRGRGRGDRGGQRDMSNNNYNNTTGRGRGRD